jgi:broad specificity phosphatase PhoE
MTRLLLLRHGQSEWNASGRWQGQADPPLSELGEHQARVAAERLDGVDAVVSSDLQRARRTADIIADALGLGPVAVEAAVRERDAGEWSGLTRDEIERAFPGYLAERKRPPGFEDEHSVRDRALAGVARIASSNAGRTVVVVTHGGVVYALERHLGLTDWEPLANLAGRWLEAGGEQLRLGERVLLVDPHDVAVTVPRQL